MYRFGIGKNTVHALCQQAAAIPLHLMIPGFHIPYGDIQALCIHSKKQEVKRRTTERAKNKKDREIRESLSVYYVFPFLGVIHYTAYHKIYYKSTLFLFLC